MNTDPRQVLRWQQHRSANFVFSFLQDSAAERDVTTVASRAEATREATVTALGLTDPLGEKIRVYLSDVPGDGGPQEGGVWEIGGQRLITVYLGDDGGEGLERAVVELLMISALDADAVRAAALVDGALGYVSQWTRGGASELDAALLRLQGEGRQISLPEALRGPAPEAKALYRQVSTSFVSFLLGRYGTQAFARFVRAFDPDDPDAASQSAYEKPFAALEGEWRVSLEGTGDSVLDAMRRTKESASGMMHFLRRAFAYLKPYWGRQILALLLTAVGAAFTVALPIAFGQVISALSEREPDYTYISWVVITVVVLFLVQAPATFCKEYLVSRMGARVMNDMRIKMFEHLQTLSANYFVRVRPGDITSRFSNDLGIIEITLTKMLPLLVTLGVTFLASLITLIYLDWRLAIGVIVALPVFFIIPARLGKRAAKVVPEQQKNKATVASTIQENVGAQQVVKAYGLQRMTLADFRAQLDKLGKSASLGNFLSALPGTSATQSVALLQVLALVGGAFLVYQGSLEIGAMTSFQLLIGSVTGPLMTLSSIMQMFLQASAGMQRVDELLDEKPQVTDRPDACQLGRFSHKIRFDGVNFSYTGEQVNLRDVNLTIPAGQTVAFVGPSGSGKSTILNLVLRFYDPLTGTVTMDGQDLREVTQGSLRGQIGTVFQEAFLYNATVRENIRLAKSEATDYQVEKAAKAAEIHDFILTLPQGYDTPVGERGGRLSGGQKQRIALARAILYDPSILVLDEPTSALDPQTEAAINATLEKLSEGRTVLMVTHRLASVANVDRIVVLERGRIAEEGTHEELLRRKGLYHRLWNQQNAPGGQDNGVGRETSLNASKLRAVPYFKILDASALGSLAEQLVPEHHEAGRRIFAMGDPGDAMYLIERGEVELLATDPTGTERQVAVKRDGDPFGEAALLKGAERPFTARATAATDVLRLDRERFMSLLQTVSGLQEAFDRAVEERRRANEAAMQKIMPAGAKRMGVPPPAGRPGSPSGGPPGGPPRAGAPG